MKIATLMSGHYRTGDTCYKHNKKNFIDVYNPDYYILPYLKEPEKEVTLFNISKNSIDSLKYKEIDIPNILSKYKPKSFKVLDGTIDSKVVLCHENYHNYTQVSKVLEMIANTFDLVEGSYDVIVKTRFDIAIQHIDFKDYDGSLTFLPFRNDVSDTVFFGSQENFKKFCDGVRVFLNTLDNRILSHAENAIKTICVENKIPFKVVDKSVIDCLLVKKSCVRTCGWELPRFSSFEEFETYKPLKNQ